MLERILARRLSYLAETTNLLYISQIDNRLYKSAIDTTLLLKNKVEINKTNKLKTTTLFLNITIVSIRDIIYRLGG